MLHLAPQILSAHCILHLKAFPAKTTIAEACGPSCVKEALRCDDTWWCHVTWSITGMFSPHIKLKLFTVGLQKQNNGCQQVLWSLGLGLCSADLTDRTPGWSNSSGSSFIWESVPPCLIGSDWDQNQGPPLGIWLQLKKQSAHLGWWMTKQVPVYHFSGLWNKSGLKTDVLFRWTEMFYSIRLNYATVTQ